MGGGFTSWGLAVPGSRGSGGHPVEDRMSIPPIWRKAEVQVDQQLSRATRNGTAGVRHGYERTEPFLTAHQTVLADWSPRVQQGAGRTSNAEHVRGAPKLAAPGLVLVAALAIPSGYHWLHLFPNGSFRPAALLFVLLATPATFALTRHLGAPEVPAARIVARVSAGMGLVLGRMVAVDPDSPLRRVLGVTSLVLAAALVSLAFASERRRLPSVHRD